jgi:hypothetical protein
MLPCLGDGRKDIFHGNKRQKKLLAKMPSRRFSNSFSRKGNDSFYFILFYFILAQWKICPEKVSSSSSRE